MPFLALLVGLMLPASHTAPPVADFDLRLQREGNEWRVSCASGCRYFRASISCTGDCEIIITNRGVQTRRDEALASTDFAFVVSPQDNGWKAVSLHGTSWRELSANCTRGACRTRITEHAVSLR